MDLKELHSFKMSDAVTFHDNLNPKLFRGQHLQPEVELQLKHIAQDFLQEMGIHDLDVRDITISGSNAAYSYTDHSDLDLHILVNMKDLPDDDIYHEFFKAKKDLYNDSHDITINGIPVELYIQDAAEPVTSLGEYSIKDKKWLRLPTKRRAHFDQTSTKSKYIKLLDIIDTTLQSDKIGKVNKVLKKIKQYRQSGLDKGGEFSPENLAYKALRSRGYITKLYDLRDRLHSKHLSLNGMYSNVNEAVTDNYLYHATMPAGMMRILRTGIIKATDRPQPSTKARTQYPTISTTRSKQYAESKDFVDFLNLPNDGNAVILVFDRNTVANHYKMFSTSQGTQTVGDEYEEVIVAPKGAMPIKGTLKGFYFNPRSTEEIEGYKDIPWFNELLTSPYYIGPKQGVAEGSLNELAPSPGFGGDDDDDKYTPADYGKPFKANYLGQNKFEVFCRKPQDPSNVIKLNAEVQKYGLEWEENFGFWFLDSPGAVYLSWKYGEIPLPKAIDQARNPGHIHDLVVDYLTNSPHAAEIQKIATKYFGFTADGEMNEGVAEGTTVTRIDSNLITDFGSSLKAYKHTDDWSQSGVDTGDDSYWKNKNLKTNTTKGLFAGDPKRTALYATGNAHETRYVEFTQNGQPIVYFDRKDLPAMRSRKTYLTVFDASDFRQLPTGEWFSENPSKPIKQVPIGDPFKYIADQGWIVRVTDNLDKVFKQVQNMHKAGKIAQYGAEGMNESKQGVAEASGYIPSEKQKNDPRFSTALTVDVKPDSIKKNAKAFYWNTSRAGIPPTAKPSGKI